MSNEGRYKSEMGDTEAEDTSTLGVRTVAVSLTTYNWHALLSTLEFAMKFVNRDTTQAVQLYEMIATQLSGVPVVVHQYQGENA